MTFSNDEELQKKWKSIVSVTCCVQRTYAFVKELVNKMVEAIQSGKMKMYFYAETIPDDKKTIKITTEALSEALFDTGWYFKDNDIEDSDFEVVIISEDERTQDLYKNECKKLGLI